MEDFDFHYHMPTTRYPESGSRMQLGNSYVFTSDAVAPDQRIITLHFDAMFNYWDSAIGAPDVTKNPTINFYRLELFYQRHRLSKSFNYTHPQYGLLVCKFNKPLETPKPSTDGVRGKLQGFSVELMEIP